MKKARVFSIVFVVVLLAVAVIAEAQQVKKVPRIGFLLGATPSANTVRIEAFRQGLRDLGYVEGKNIVIEERYAEGKLDRLPALAAELVRLKVDIIVSAGPTVTRVVKEATVTIPTVMGFDDDPVGSGFVASHWKFDAPRHCTINKRDGIRRSGVQSTASKRRRTRSQGY